MVNQWYIGAVQPAGAMTAIAPPAGLIEFSIRIKIHFITIVISNRKNLDPCGYCDNLDYGRNPRNFKIEVHNNMTKQETLETLAHESVHIAQWATNTMRDGKNRTVLFDGKPYTMNNRDPNVYYFSPWEIDAYGRSIGLVVLWRLHNLKKAKKR